MAQKPHTDEQIRETVAAFEANGRNKCATGKALGLAQITIRRRLKIAAARGMLGFAPVLEGFEVTQTTETLNADGSLRARSIKQSREHGEEFKVPEGQFLKRVSTLTDADGRTIVQWNITDQDKVDILARLRAAVDEMKCELPRVAPTKGPEHANELLLNQYTVTDLHMGMLAWREETGDADYDLKIAERLILDWFSAAIAMSPNAAVGLLAQLGDLMHHDALESVTPAHKHVLDADSRLQKMIRVVIRVLRQIIAMMLRKYPQVHLVMASANHDPASSAWLRELLFAMYENEPRITVDNSPDIYYAYEWGKTALFYHHGHKRKIADVDSVFAGKFRELFGRCPKCYGHIGHLHNDEVKESNLMKVERHRTLAPKDSFAAGGGWLSDRDAKVITYHKQFGEVFRGILSPEMVVGASS